MYKKMTSLVGMVAVAIVAFGMIFAGAAMCLAVNNPETSGEGKEFLDELARRNKSVLTDVSEYTYEYTFTKEVVLKKKVVTKKSSYLPKSYKKVLKKGRNGKGYRTTTYTALTSNDKVIFKHTDTEVIKKPKKRVVLRGTRDVVSKVNRGGNRIDNVEKTIKMTATAYTSSGGRKTASGKWPGVGKVAVDPKVIPLGSLLYVQYLDDKNSDYGYCVAADTGSAIKGKRIDLYFKSRKKCINFGRQKVKVLVLS